MMLCHCQRKVLNMKRISLFLTLLSVAISLAAQPKGLELRAWGVYDCHPATGGYGAFAAQGLYPFSEGYALGLGLELATSSRVALNLQGEARLWHTAKGDLFLENRYLYRQFPSLNRQEFSGALQLGWKADHVRLMLGLCNRYSGELVLRSNGGMGILLEPMNVLFAAEGHLKGEQARWDAALRWSNYNDFVIERVSFWTYSLKGHYCLNNNLKLIGEVGFHPLGSLNLTSSYEGWFMHLGADYKF